MKLTIIGRNGATQTVEASPGRSVMETIRDSGFDELVALCGGSCACGTCHVYVDSDALGRLSPQGMIENDLLEMSRFRTESSRLSCQIRVDDQIAEMSVTIAPEE